MLENRLGWLIFSLLLSCSVMKLGLVREFEEWKVEKVRFEGEIVYTVNYIDKVV